MAMVVPSSPKPPPPTKKMPYYPNSNCGPTMLPCQGQSQFPFLFFLKFSNAQIKKENLCQTKRQKKATGRSGERATREALAHGPIAVGLRAVCTLAS